MRHLHGAVCTGQFARGSLHRPFARGSLHRPFARGGLHGQRKPRARGICPGGLHGAVCTGRFTQEVCPGHLHESVRTGRFAQGSLRRDGLHRQCKPFARGTCRGHLHGAVCTGRLHRPFGRGALHRAVCTDPSHRAACTGRLPGAFAQTGSRLTDAPWGHRSLRAGLLTFTSQFSNLTLSAPPPPKTFGDAPQVVPPHPGLASRA